MDPTTCLFHYPEKVGCFPAHAYAPHYYFTRYPLEKSKLWNLKNLLTPSSWLTYFLTIIVAITCLKIACYVGKRLGLSTITEEIALVPFRECIYHSYR